MRLHRLEVQAFGPFAARERVDVDALAHCGLFLLHGPTGAGKTSVLDAVCFALYGRVPGTRSGGGSLRSDHAPEGLAPEVLVEVTVGGRRFEVTRSPAWQRPKKRGTGVTSEPARMLVRERVGGRWTPLSSRNDEASQLLTDVLGMGLEQFTRVVLLPQGEFAAFLRAPADERRPLLQRLFGTDRFAEVEAWLGEQRRLLAAELEEADASLDRVLARVEQAASALPADDETDDRAPGARRSTDGEGVAADGGPDARLDDPEADPVLRCERLRDRAVAVLQRRREERDAARSRREEALGRSDALEAERCRAQRLASALAERDELVRQAADVRRVKVALERARAAQSLAGDLRTVEAAARERDRSRERLRHVLASAETSGLGDIADLPAPQLADRERAAREEVGRLADLLALESATLRTAERRERLAADVARMREQTADAARDLELAAGQVDASTRRVDELVPVADDLPLARRGLTDAASRLAAARRGEELRADLRHEQADLGAATDDAQSARQAWLDLREQRLAGMAAELASQLVDGAACPVCGSQEHPSPAPSPERIVTEADEQDARDAAEVAAARRDRAERRLSAVRSALAVQEEVSASASVETGERLHDEARDRLRAAEQAASELSQQRKLLEQLVREQETRAADRSAVVERLAASTAELAEVDRSLAEAQARLDAARGVDAGIAARRERLEREAAIVQDLCRTREAVDMADAALKRAEQDALSAAGLARFDDADDARSALLQADEMRKHVRTVERHGEATAAVEGRLAEEELRLAAVEHADRQGRGEAQERLAERTHEAEVALLAAEAVDERAAADLAVAQSTATALELLREQVEADVAATGPLRLRHALVADLARCAEGTGGGNVLRMRLSSYVLAARLEQVAAAATVRLDEMSAGRYGLVHTDAVERGGRRSGLGLQVVDAWTGQQRETSTLSGGESFLAPLALALGLADVVQAEAGGTAIETLFVDEGFGSLDAETLDDVMAVLDGLRDGGRCVGLVSHVSDLQQRIPARLEVVKTRTGSSLRVTGTAAAARTA
ncbi:MAG: AAA family ATPase [Actinomycetes bacterium]